MKRLERRALNRVAGIDEQDVWMFFTNAFDQRRDFGDAAVVGFVRVVIDGVDVAVQIGGAEDRDLNAIRGEAPAHENQGEHD